MRESLGDLNSLLFEQLERLGNEDLKQDALKEEITRAKAISDVATRIIANAELVLRAAKFNDEKIGDARLPKLLGGEE